jgi:lysine 2,3-aminomutase
MFARLLSIPHIQRIRFASKGLAVAPCRITDDSDSWANTLIELSNKGREITWVTREAANHLFKHGVIVRNQSVLLKGVNDTEEDLSNLIGTLASMNIQPVRIYVIPFVIPLLYGRGSDTGVPSSPADQSFQYYIYQCDMVRGIEDLRTPLSKILELDQKLRGTLSGFMMPAFVIDLPGGGGKRLVSTMESYDEVTGVAEYRAPGLPGDKGKTLYTYHDPTPVDEAAVAELRQEQEQAIEQDVPLQDLVYASVPQQRQSPPPPVTLRQPPRLITDRVPPRTTLTHLNQTPIAPGVLASQHLGLASSQPSSSAMP